MNPLFDTLSIRRESKREIPFYIIYIMKKFFFAVSMAALLLSGAMTLNANNAKSDNKDKHIGRFADNWYVQFGGGVSTFRDNGAWGRLKPAVSVDLGKWLTPNWGFRLGYQGLAAQASDTSVGWFAGKESFGFHYTHLDWIYNPIGCEKAFNVNPYIHAGGILTPWNGLLKAEAGIGPGLLLNLRIAGNLAVHADARLILAREETWRASGSTVCFMSATAGLSYAFGWGKSGKVGFTKHTREVDVVHIEVLKECAHDAVIKNLEAQLAKAQADTIVVEKPIVSGWVTYFTLNHSELTEKERYHLMDLLKVVPENATLIIRGHADKETGTKKRNRVLSEERVDTVHKALIELGFKGKIQAESYGDNANPFTAPHPKNRCVTIDIQL